jgi:hypothetical protein
LLLSQKLKTTFMKKHVLLCAFVLALGHYCAAQAKSVYFELGGPGLASFNFDSRFSKSEAGLGGRVGIGGFSVGGEGLVFIPVGVNYIVGKDRRNYFEMGAGVTPVVGTGSTGNFTETFGHLIFGYRMQPVNGGFTFRAFINPVFGSGFFVPYWAGLSFGYKF